MIALCFRNGPIEEVHAGRPCQMFAGQKEYSQITDEEMRLIIRNAVSQSLSFCLSSRLRTQANTSGRLPSVRSIPCDGMILSKRDCETLDSAKRNHAARLKNCPPSFWHGDGRQGESRSAVRLGGENIAKIA